MRIKLPKYYRFAFVVLIIVVAAACENRPSEVLSRSEMTDFIFELHKLDGALAATGHGSIDDRENVYYYNALFKKQGITKAQFDSSLVWYAAHPKTFDKIYSQVQERFTALQADVIAGKYHPIDSSLFRNSEAELWTMKTKYIITRDSTPDQLTFNFYDNSLRWNDKYRLRFIQRISKTDSIASKHLVLRIKYAQGVTDSMVVPLKSDSVLRRYTIYLKARRQLPIEGISGKLLSDTSHAKFYALTDSISLMRFYDALAQDSIKTVIEAIMQKQKPKVTDSVKLKKPEKGIKKKERISTLKNETDR
jgi:hypothetical protein